MPSEWTYLQSHPWLKFSLDLRRASPDLWMLLGECQSKIEHLAGVPLQPEAAQQLYDVYLAKGVQATTAIEGNTLSEKQVREAIEGKLFVPESQSYLKREVDNVIAACNRIGAEILAGGEPSPLSFEVICQYNRDVLAGAPLPDGGTAGEVSPHNVTVGRYLGAPRSECEHLMRELCRWLESDYFAPVGELKLGTSLLKAVLAHLYLAWIHPFPDGNGRTARLIEFRILLASGVPAPTAHLFSNHYNLTRAEYYRQLDASSRSGGDVIPFIQYALAGLRDGLREQIKYVQKQQHQVMWRHYVHERFREKHTPSDKRRRDLVLAISDTPGVIPRSRLRGLTPALAQAYAGKTERTLTRDINVLRKMTLIARGPSGFRTRKDLMKAFLPKRKSAGAANTTPPESAKPA